jgi:RNA recognition motif-containing protein
MSNKIFVGGLSWGTDSETLRETCEAYGEVSEARVITDRDTGRSRGFGFVTYDSSEDANKAIEALNGSELDGRTLRVNEAQDRRRDNNSGPGRSGGGGGGGRNRY